MIMIMILTSKLQKGGGAVCARKHQPQEVMWLEPIRTSKTFKGGG